VRIAIGNSQLRAEISTLGAELILLREKQGLDLLWNADPSYWPECSPLLFPVVGRVKDNRIRVGNSEHEMMLHGFARTSQFVLEERSKEHCTFSLTSNDTTLLNYPFRFKLSISYHIVDATLQVTARMDNEGASPMPASFGFHPGFQWPLPFGGARNEHEVRFQYDETAPVRRLVQGLLSRDTYMTPVKDRKIALRDDLFEAGAIIWDELKSHWVEYGAMGGRSLRVSFPGMPHLGLWTRPGAGFVCIEPWHGYASPEDFDGAIDDKPGTFLVAPKQSRHFTMQVALSDTV
jgi:galactose mutarotase-like enzyme